MPKNRKYFNRTLLLCCLLIFGYRFYDYKINKNFFIEVNTKCNIETEKCFKPQNGDSFSTEPYKIVTIIDKYAPSCLEEHNCDNFYCSEDSKYCTIRYCDINTNKEGEECVDNVNLNQ